MRIALADASAHRTWFLALSIHDSLLLARSQPSVHEFRGVSSELGFLESLEFRAGRPKGQRLGLFHQGIHDVDLLVGVEALSYERPRTGRFIRSDQSRHDRGALRSHGWEATASRSRSLRGRALALLRTPRQATKSPARGLFPPRRPPPLERGRR